MYYPSESDNYSDQYDDGSYDSDAIMYDESDPYEEFDSYEEVAHITIDPHDPPSHTTTYTVHFFNHNVQTTVTSKPAVVRDWLYKLLNLHRSCRHKLVVGLGVQWEESSRAAATLQLCIGRQCLIFQLLYANSVPLALHRFLNDRRNTFVGVNNYNDASMLWRSEHRLEVARIVDVRHVAAAWRGLSSRISMETLAERVLGYAGVMKPESVGRSDWGADWLSPEQVQYACVDAFVSFL